MCYMFCWWYGGYFYNCMIIMHEYYYFNMLVYELYEVNYVDMDFMILILLCMNSMF